MAMRKVRTMAGVKFFDAPIGTPITPGMVKTARAKFGDKRTDNMLVSQQRNTRRDARRAHFQNQAQVRAKKRQERVEGNAARRAAVRRDAEIREMQPPQPGPGIKVRSQPAAPKATGKPLIAQINAALDNPSATQEHRDLAERIRQQWTDLDAMTRGTDDWTRLKSSVADDIESLGDKVGADFDAKAAERLKALADTVRPKTSTPSKTSTTNTDMENLFDLVHAQGPWNEKQVAQAIELVMKYRATGDPQVRELLQALVKRLQKEE